MKAFDEIAADAFQRGDDGKWIFFPPMRLFGSYEVPNEQRKLELQSQTAEFLEVTLWLSLAVMFIAGSFGRILVGSLAMQAAIVAASINFAQRSTRFLVKSSVRYDSAKRRVTSVRSRGVQRLAAVTALYIALTILAGYAIQLQPQLWGPLLAVAAFAVLSIVLWARTAKSRLDLHEVQTQTNR